MWANRLKGLSAAKHELPVELKSGWYLGWCERAELRNILYLSLLDWRLFKKT